MNWIIDKTQRMGYHTDLGVILSPLIDVIDDYNWILTDLEFMSNEDNLPINMSQNYFILNPTGFKSLLKKYAQIIWGVIIGVPIGINIETDKANLPYAEFNDMIWKNGNLQYPNAAIEIICFDSSYTIVKFTKQEHSDKFKSFFGEAIELEKFK